MSRPVVVQRAAMALINNQNLGDAHLGIAAGRRSARLTPAVATNTTPPEGKECPNRQGTGEGGNFPACRTSRGQTRLDYRNSQVCQGQLVEKACHFPPRRDHHPQVCQSVRPAAPGRSPPFPTLKAKNPPAATKDAWHRTESLRKDVHLYPHSITLASRPTHLFAPKSICLIPRRRGRNVLSSPSPPALPSCPVRPASGTDDC